MGWVTPSGQTANRDTGAAGGHAARRHRLRQSSSLLYGPADWKLQPRAGAQA